MDTSSVLGGLSDFVFTFCLDITRTASALRILRLTARIAFQTFTASWFPIRYLISHNRHCNGDRLGGSSLKSLTCKVSILHPLTGSSFFATQRFLLLSCSIRGTISSRKNRRTKHAAAPSLTERGIVLKFPLNSQMDT